MDRIPTGDKNAKMCVLSLYANIVTPSATIPGSSFISKHIRYYSTETMGILRSRCCVIEEETYDRLKFYSLAAIDVIFTVNRSQSH